MAPTKVDHIGVAVSNVEDSVKIYASVLGINPADIHREVTQGMKIVMVPVGESKIELLESIEPDGVIAKFIASRGEGIHHLAVGVKDIKAELERLKKQGVPLVDKEPRVGAGGHKTAFIHPKATKILLELVEAEH